MCGVEEQRDLFVEVLAPCRAMLVVVAGRAAHMERTPAHELLGTVATHTEVVVTVVYGAQQVQEPVELLFALRQQSTYSRVPSRFIRVMQVVPEVHEPPLDRTKQRVVGAKPGRKVHGLPGVLLDAGGRLRLRGREP